MPNKPLVSILMTVYNHEEYLEQSIRSIKKQTYKNWELVLIDNGSTDSSKKILVKFKHKKIRIFFFKQNIGRTNCLNFGLNKCKGKYVAILDSDDISHKDRIELQVKEFSKDKKLWLLATNFDYIDKKIHCCIRNSFVKNAKHNNYTQ